MFSLPLRTCSAFQKACQSQAKWLVSKPTLWTAYTKLLVFCKLIANYQHFGVKLPPSVFIEFEDMATLIWIWYLMWKSSIKCHLGWLRYFFTRIFPTTSFRILWVGKWKPLGHKGWVSFASTWHWTWQNWVTLCYINIPAEVMICCRVLKLACCVCFSTQKLHRFFNFLRYCFRKGVAFLHGLGLCWLMIFEIQLFCPLKRYSVMLVLIFMISLSNLISMIARSVTAKLKPEKESVVLPLITKWVIPPRFRLNSWYLILQMEHWQ